MIRCGVEIMVKREVFKFRNKCVDYLVAMFGENNVKKEWDVAKDSKDDLTRDLYCPRVDIAVGPYNIDRSPHAHMESAERIQQAYEKNRSFLRVLNSRSINTIRGDNLNRNPRCFLAVEIENTGSRKTRIGSIINASAIGKIGIVVAWNQEVLGELKRIEDYLNFLREVGKMPEAFKNILIIKKEDFSETLNLNLRASTVLQS